MDVFLQQTVNAISLGGIYALLALGLAVVFSLGSPWSLVAIGVALMLTLPVDRWLAARGLAPAGWIALRIPLSVGLGLLTIASGVLVSA